MWKKHKTMSDKLWLTFVYFVFCRLYQVRCSLKVSPGKLPIQIETCIPDQNANNQTTGPCIINGAGVSKVFQILYRNEEISLRDVIMFRAHLLGKFVDFIKSCDMLNSSLYKQNCHHQRLFDCPNDNLTTWHKSWLRISRLSRFISTAKTPTVKKTLSAMSVSTHDLTRKKWAKKNH